MVCQQYLGHGAIAHQGAGGKMSIRICAIKPRLRSLGKIHEPLPDYGFFLGVVSGMRKCLALPGPLISGQFLQGQRDGHARRVSKDRSLKLSLIAYKMSTT